ncbi:MAG: hypothetical protein ACYTGQ_05235 [Planctomycetota bacterium]|jgi:hypothetical protein
MTLPVLIVLLVAQIGLASFMAGLIWFVQVVHYPLFAGVGGDRFKAYELAHTARTTWVVGPVMLGELMVAVTLVVWTLSLAHSEAVRGWGVVYLMLLVLIWSSTMLFQVPAHDHLERGFDEKAWRWLVATNWLRTAGWTARSGVSLMMLMLWMTEQGGPRWMAGN